MFYGDHMQVVPVKGKTNLKMPHERREMWTQLSEKLLLRHGLVLPLLAGLCRPHKPERCGHEEVVPFLASE